MRFLCFLFLVAFIGLVGAFGYYNRQDVELRLFDWTLTASVAVIVGASYVLGMLSGWSVVGMVRRSIHRVTDRPVVLEREYTHAR